MNGTVYSSFTYAKSTRLSTQVIYIYIIACYEGQTKNDFFPRLSNKVNKFSRFCSSSIKLEIKPKLIMEKISLYNPYSTLVIRLCFSSI